MTRRVLENAAAVEETLRENLVADDVHRDLVHQNLPPVREEGPTDFLSERVDSSLGLELAAERKFQRRKAAAAAVHQLHKTIKTVAESHGCDVVESMAQ